MEDHHHHHLLLLLLPPPLPRDILIAVRLSADPVTDTKGAKRLSRHPLTPTNSRLLHILSAAPVIDTCPSQRGSSASTDK